MSAVKVQSVGKDAMKAQQWSTTRSGRRQLVLGAACLAVSVLTVACGTSSGGGPVGESSAPVTNDASAAAQARDKVADMRAGKEFGAPPSSAPKPQPGKKIWGVAYSLDAPGGREFAEAAKEAGKMFGWDVTVTDSAYTPSTAVDLIRQGIAAGADGLLQYSIDCASTQSALQDAKQAGIKIVAVEGVDCNDAGGTGKPLFDYNVHYQQGEYLKWTVALAVAQAQWAIAATDGHAVGMYLNQTDSAFGPVNTRAFNDELKKCGSCGKPVPVDFVGADIGTTLEQKVATALQQHPDVNVVAVPYDALVSGGVGTAVRQAGRDVKLIAGEGQQATLDGIRAKTVAATLGLVPEWEAYAGMDNLNRLFNGRPGEASGQGFGLVDATNIDQQSAGRSYVPPADFKTAYQKAWGVG
ncbi:substrate-binding domain-containing protein [Streptomyces sp. SKN60]|uniref:sugar ABC transporter substrate-binding protein n=1 Tax=Streptomyces sp. SKN60 TaxID=2855506 RepID=UPI00224746C4|nr:substrate-binding domain-containing protein [Streptomyces sp. SKN60]MCX2185759.1 substrate-binding domain-containing protein [Streptomyces sp. SKN60]